jgi:hypothetical protein
MMARSAAPAVALALALAVAIAACLPETVGPLRSTGNGPVVEEPTASAEPSGPTPSPSFVRPTPTPLPSFLSVVVKRGDSLNTIAHAHGTTARSIAFWNRATYPTLDPESSRYSPNSIRVGWTLVLIPGVVFDEDTLPDSTPTPVPSASF